MLWIANQREPAEFREWRRLNAQGVKDSYGALPGDVKRAVRSALIKDQKYLCAYTMKKIWLERSHIEHVKPQSKHRESDLDYCNMLACYPGDREGKVPYGAKFKDDSEVEILNPHDSKVDGEFRYASNGEIIGNSELARQTIEVLNLNHEQLCADRRHIMQRWKKQLVETKSGLARCQRILADYDSAEQLPEYYGVIRQVLSDHAAHQAKRAQRINREKRE